MCFEHVQLHNHTNKSMLDGIPDVAELVAHAKSLGAKAVGVSEHGNLLSEYPFYKAAKDFDIQPVMGMEAYILNGAEYLRTAKKQVLTREEIETDPLFNFYKNLPESAEAKIHNHLLLFALNQKGLENLHKIATFTHQHVYRKPSLTHSFLKEHSDGILATSGCLAAEIPALLSKGLMTEAEFVLQWYLELFKDRFFLEFQRHNIPELDETVNYGLLELAKKYKVPVLATNDIHYLRPEDKQIQDILLKIGTSGVAKKSNESDDSGDAFSIQGDGYHYRTPEEMFETFKVYGEDIAKDMLNNSIAIAQDVRYERTISKDFLLPVTEPGLTKEQKAQKLRDMVYEGARKRYPERIDSDGNLSPDLIERLDFELGVITSMGLTDYFFILKKVIDHIRDEKVIWNIRGSGGGSVVLYALGVSHTDPLRHNLLFERFLNPTRVTMPDVDIDIEDTFREPLAKWLQQEYGEDKVARILAYGKMKLKAAIREAARQMGVKPANIDILSKAVPNDYSTVEELEANENFMHLMRQYVNYQKILDLTRMIVGRDRTISTHPAGVLIFDKDFTNYTGLHKPTKDSSGEGGDDDGGFSSLYPAQVDMGAAELAGFVKFDFLGQRSLSIVAETLKAIKDRHGKELGWDDIPCEYNDAYDIYATGDTVGIFQVSSDQMRDIFKRLQPKSLDQIVAIISLYRPGPLKYIDPYIERSKGKEYDLPSEKLKPILEETYGIMVYQEQIIQTLKLAGFSGGDADTIRRAISKKKIKEMAKYKDEFIAGMKKNFQMSEEESEKIWDDILEFAGYGFNKSHASSYAEVSAKTAWLKKNYRLEYLLASMNCEIKHNDKVMVYVGDARKSGIKVLPADVNASDALFKIEGKNIRYGLLALKHVNQENIMELVAEREANGKFESIEDLLNRVKMNTSTFAALLLAGAFDSLVLSGVENGTEVSPRYMAYSQSPKKYKNSVRKMAGLDKDKDGKKLSVEEQEERVPKSFAEWLKSEVSVVGETYLTTHPIILWLGGRKLSTVFNKKHPVVFADFAMERIPVNGEGYILGIIRSVYHNIKKNWLFLTVGGFNPPDIRLAAFRNFEALSKVANEDYLCLIKVFRSEKGFTIQEIQSIGHVYSPTTYLNS